MKCGTSNTDAHSHTATHSHTLTHIRTLSVFPIALVCVVPLSARDRCLVLVWKSDDDHGDACRPAGRLHDPDFPVPGRRRRITFQTAITVSVARRSPFQYILSASAPNSSLSSYIARLLL